MRQTIRPNAVPVLFAMLMAVLAVLWAGALPAETVSCEGLDPEATKQCCDDCVSYCDGCDEAGRSEVETLDAAIAVTHASLVRYIEGGWDPVIASTQNTLAVLTTMRAEMVCKLKPGPDDRQTD